MSKNKNANKKSSKKSSKKNTAAKAAAAAPVVEAKRGVGRPKYPPKFPRNDKWTMEQFQTANMVDLETGKGPKCSKLTLIKFLARDTADLGENSIVVKLDEKRPPNSETGLGRKKDVFMLRVKYNERLAKEAAAAPVSAVTITAPVDPTDIVSVPAESTPAVDLAPATVPEETPAPETAPVTVDVSPETAAYEAQKAALLS